MKYTDLSCFACGKEFASEMTTGFTEQDPPSGGTVFSAKGNYGSTVWDPPVTSKDYLLVIICDGCLIARKERVMECQPVRMIPHIRQEPWEGN